MLPRVYENHLLSRLAHTDAMTLEWEHVELPTGPIPDTDSSRYVYFPCDGLIVLGAHEPAKGMQVALVGRRGSSGVFLQPRTQRFRSHTGQRLAGPESDFA